MQHLPKAIQRAHPFTHNPILWDVFIVMLVLFFLGAMKLVAHPLLDILAAIGALTIVYGSFIEPRRIHLNKKSIRIPGLPAMKIILIADFHCGPFKKARYLKRVVEKANALKPDLILLPGDFVYDHDSNLDDLEPLKNLKARYGMYATLGNHDSGHHLLNNKIHYQTRDISENITEYVRELGITILRNESLMISIDGKKIAIAGIDDLWMESADLEKTLQHVADAPVILLSHNPDVILHDRNTRASLIVSGHTHGGQVRLPFIGSIYPIPDRLGRSYDQGIFHLSDKTTLAVTHGIGETMARARLFCPPEILVLNIN